MVLMENNPVNPVIKNTCSHRPLLDFQLNDFFCAPTFKQRQPLQKKSIFVVIFPV